MSAPGRLPPDHEAVAGMSDEAVKKATGKDWATWSRILDDHGAHERPHVEIASWVRQQHEGVSGWWAQAVTVAYERFRGLRDVGQRRDGGYEVNKSKTIGVPVAELWRAFFDESVRSRWLPDDLEVRTTNEGRSARMRLGDDTSLDAHFIDKGEAKSALSLQHRGLADKEAAEAKRTYWGERLETLAELLTAD